jgi:hypothetical protein
VKVTVFRIRTYADPATPTDVWLIERDGATEQELMHGEVRAGGLRSLLELIDPHERKLYDFKAAVGMLPWLTMMIGKERTRSMPLTHQQCLHSAPEPIPENVMTCGLGKKLSECPILTRLRETFDQERGRKRPDGGDSFYAEITDEQVDQVAAMTCVWHMLMGSDGFVDWQEGAVQTTSDRMYWERLYANLAEQPEPMGDESEGECPSCGSRLRYREVIAEADVGCNYCPDCGWEGGVS